MKPRIIVVAAAVAFAGCKSGSSSPSTPTAPSPTVSSVVISLTNDIIFGGGSEQATATVTMSNGTTQQMAGVWNVDNGAVASVDGNGRVTGAGSGRAAVSFSASGVTGSRPFRVVPSYQGQWSGSYFVTGCSHSGALAAINFCGDFPNNRVLPMNMTLTQGARDVVEGRTFLGSLQSDGVTGPVETDGAVQFSGIIRSGSTTIDVFWRFNALQPGRMIGALRQTWRVSGASGQADIAGDFRDMNRTTAASERAAPAGVVPGTLRDAVRAVIGS